MIYMYSFLNFLFIALKSESLNNTCYDLGVTYIVDFTYYKKRCMSTLYMCVMFQS